MAPATEAELAATIAEAARDRRPLAPRGGGTRSDPAAAPRGEPLSTARLTGIVDYEPGALTLIARAGTPLAAIEAALAAEGQALAFEPPDLRGLLGTAGAPTIGGVVATNASGPRRLLAGACRDHLLGLRFVDGRGRILRTGGRVMKNVTGLDLGKLLCGARGTLGVLTEVALKTLPAPRASLTLAFPGTDLSGAIDLFTAALSTPWEVSGAAWRAGTAWLRLEAPEAQLAYRRDRLTGLLGTREVEDLDAAATTALWRDLRDLTDFAPPGVPVWRVLTRPSRAAALAGALAETGGAVALDWGGHLLWYAGPAEGAAIRALPGGRLATRIRRGDGPADAAFPPEADPLAARLHAVFDPAGILNPGPVGG
ncbi:MAG: FAD/FMN-containing dehydrogenase [Rhodovulum sulfidophilum]|uniref:FAD/FMN-containing dehydrogenase n=1 Tax=Rhodovulum sulfidophilum TaxID=35806 RepID=A0A2W5N4P8_RHOSU|nr:MAG: FAD/FMN-containing dehydrogenase [Rhodovulum sulfidophilum]